MNRGPLIPIEILLFMEVSLFVVSGVVHHIEWLIWLPIGLWLFHILVLIILDRLGY